MVIPQKVQKQKTEDNNRKLASLSLVTVTVLNVNTSKIPAWGGNAMLAIKSRLLIVHSPYFRYKNTNKLKSWNKKKGK